MKKKFITFLAVALLCTITAGCNTNSLNTQPSQENNGSSTNTPPQCNSNNIPNSSTATGFVNLTKVNTSVLGSGTENGFYETRPADNRAANIVYIDYDTAKEIYLCAIPNCKHNSETCSAWISAEDAGVFPLVAGKYLLLVKRTYGGETGKLAISRIETLEMDGTNRKVLIEFDANEYLGDVFSSNGSVLICSVRTRDAQDAISTTLISIDLATGERTDFHKTSASGNGEKIYYGTTQDGYCILREVIQQKSAKDFPELDEKQAIMEANKHVEQIWYSISVAGNSETEISRGSANLVYQDVCEKGLFLLDCATKEITLTNASDGKCKTLATLPQDKIDGAFINGTIDNWLIVDTHDNKTGQETTVKRFAVNTEDATIKELSIMSKYGKANPVAPYILGYDSMNVLLISQQTGGGDVHYGYGYSVISKADYLNSVDTQMKKVEFIEDRK